MPNPPCVVLPPPALPASTRGFDSKRTAKRWETGSWGKLEAEEAGRISIQGWLRACSPASLHGMQGGAKGISPCYFLHPQQQPNTAHAACLTLSSNPAPFNISESCCAGPVLESLPLSLTCSSGVGRTWKTTWRKEKGAGLVARVQQKTAHGAPGLTMTHAVQVLTEGGYVGCVSQETH